MTDQGWSARCIAVTLYPFAAGAAGVNVFFASLLGSRIGLPVLSTGWSFVAGCVLGIPAALVFAHHIRRLMDKASPSTSL